MADDTGGGGGGTAARPQRVFTDDDDTLCGEGPVWDARGGRLVWADIGRSVVYAYRAGDGSPAAISRGLNVTGVALNDDGRLVFAGPTGLHLWRGPGDSRTLVRADAAGEDLPFNDIVAGPGGRVYAGTLYWDERGMRNPGKLYLIEPDGAARAVDDGIELSNGLGFSPDDRTLYYADSAARRIYAYDVDPADGSLSNKRVFVQVPGNEGIPDGLTVDAAGFVWCAQWYGGQVVRYDPDGRVERRVRLPVRQVASVAFGGPDLLDLYITTAGENWPSPLAPPGYDYAAGAFGGPLYRLRVQTPGRPEHRTEFR